MKRFPLIMLLMVLGLSPFAMAQEQVPAVPVGEVQAEDLAAKTSEPVVIELFSSQACVFCPRADTLLGDLIQNKNIIAMSCHVDYFDVQKGSLAHPFCTRRQGEYTEKLRTGPSYTPQIIVNGMYDAVGYRFENVLKAIRLAAKEPPLPISLKASQTKNRYQVVLPKISKRTQLTIDMAFIDRPRKTRIAEGSNTGKTVTYYNLVSRIDHVTDWSGTAKTFQMDAKLAKHHKGFVLLASDKETGQILAAGLYERPVPHISR